MFRSKNRAAVPHQALLIALLASTALVGAPVSFTPALAQSLPSGGTVAAGSASIGEQSNGTLTIHQTSTNAVVNWQTFNIGQGNTVTFVQPDAHSAILNRVTGATSTSIAGSLTANGQVYLINPNGIAITATGTVNSGAFVASTLGISDADFMAGQRSFTGTGASNGVSNAGTLTIERGGYLALIGGSVDNSGTISVPMGKVALGSGEQATLDLAGDGFLQVAIPTSTAGSDARVSNSGTISANGGMVQLSAAAARDLARQAVNMSGTVEARGASGRNGDITLFGGEGKVVVTGTVTASNDQGQGGSVTVASREIELASAVIDASGTTSGGTIHIGGERQGGGPLPHAETLVVDAGTTINADATISGNGGDVVLWSDSLTRFAGSISARGGTLSGNGGEAEVSGKARLAYTGFTDLSATNGAFGTLLLDPYNVTISSGTDNSGFTASGNDSVINASTLLTALSGANVTVSTGGGGAQAGNITVAAPLSWNAATTLTLNAASNINIDSAITAASGGLTLSSGGTILAPAAVSIGGVFNLTWGNWVQNSATLPSFYARDFQLNGGTFLRALGGDGTSGAPYRLADVYGLQGVATSATYRANWQLANDIDAAGTVNWNIGAGFAPIGDDLDRQFIGSFDGGGHVITGLVINRPTTDYVGLFGLASTSTIHNIGLVGGSITGRHFVGGLVGQNNGPITQAYATVGVAGFDYVGGLLGSNRGAIMQAYATGGVTGGLHVGGLIGGNLGTITQAFATGGVAGAYFVGGLAGSNSGTITQVYATGVVTGNSSLGGLFGQQHSGALTASFWNTQTSGQNIGVGSGSNSGVTGRTTAQMADPFTFIDAGWDFASVWATPKTGDPPVLRSLTSDPIYNYYLRLSGDTNTTYGDTIATSGIARDGVGAGNVTVGWGSAISATTNVGNYAYGVSNVLALSYSTGVAGDYYFDYGTGALTIDKRALTVTANAVTKAYGLDNPALTYTFGGAGLVNGDTLYGSLATNAGKLSELGDYTITQGSLLASSNYSMTFLAGLLTVEPASPGPGSLASGNVAPHGSAPFFPPFLPGGTSDTGGNGILIADPRFGGIVVCLEDGRCTTLPAGSAALGFNPSQGRLFMTSIGKLLSPLAMAMTFALPGIASAAPLPGGASSLVETYDDWSVVCQMQAEAPACIVRQVQTNTQTNQTILTIEIGTALDGQFQSALLLPLGLALPQGVQMTIDEAALGMPLPFSTCLPQGCVVPVTFDADTIAKLRAGKALTIIVAATASPQPVSLAVSLKGLTSALDRIATLTK